MLTIFSFVAPRFYIFTKKSCVHILNKVDVKLGEKGGRWEREEAVGWRSCKKEDVQQTI